MLKICYIQQSASFYHCSAFGRYLAHHPGVDLVFVADEIGDTPLAEPFDAYEATDWVVLDGWASGEWQCSNGYYDQAIEWAHIEAQWSRRHVDPPDLVIVYESGLVPCGDKHVFDGVPVALLAFDVPRGVDQLLRLAKSIGATDIFQTTKTFQSLFSLSPHLHPDTARAGALSGSPNSGVCFPSDHVHYLPGCADPFFFHPDSSTEKSLPIMWSGSQMWVRDGKSMERSDVDWGLDQRSGLSVITGVPPVEKFSDDQGDGFQRAKLSWFMLNDPEMPLRIIEASRDGDYADRLRRSDIAWHCQAGWNADVGGEAFRIWQAAACGTCLMTNESRTIADHFVLGEEIATFNLYHHPSHHLFEWFDYQEMKNRLLELLVDDKRREEVGRAAAERTQKEHLPKHRFQVIFEKTGVTI